MPDKTRRNFLTTSGKLLVGSAVFAGFGAFAGSHQGQYQGDSGDGMTIDAAAMNVCGTCQYWGGMRKVSKDKKNVTVQSMGWCNNPDSMNYQKLTSADLVMKKPGMWKRWPAM